MAAATAQAPRRRPVAEIEIMAVGSLIFSDPAYSQTLY
jgi:hypothetical protein